MIIKYKDAIGDAWTLLANSSIQNISPINGMVLNGVPFASVTLIDFEGGLYSTWENKQGRFICIKNNDDDEYFLIGKVADIVFDNNSLLIIIVGGLDELTDNEGFERNYILAQGIVASVDSETQLTLTDSEGVPFTDWANNRWVNNRDVAAIMTDITIASSQVWHEEDVNPTHSGWDSTNLNGAKCLVANNGLYDHGIKNGDPENNYFDYELGGVDIPNTEEIEKITVKCRIGGKPDSSDTHSYERAGFNFQLYFWNYNSSAWDKANTFLRVLPYNQADEAPVDVWSTVEMKNVGNNITSNPAYFLHDTGDNFDYIKVRILVDFETGNWTKAEVYIDFLEAEVFYQTAAFSPYQKKITANGASDITCNGATFQTNGISVGDQFQIGENTKQIIIDCVQSQNISYSIDTNLDKYIARHFKGVTRRQILNAVKILEGAFMTEYYTGDIAGLNMYRHANFPSPAATFKGHVDTPITEADYSDFKLRRPDNAYDGVKVFGNAYNSVEAVAGTIDGRIKKIIDDAMKTDPDAQDVADAQFAILQNLRPSYSITLLGDSYDHLKTGMNVYATFARPTIVKTKYPIRSISREQGAAGKKGNMVTRIELGLGATTTAEALAKYISSALEKSEMTASNILLPAASSGGYTDEQAAAKIASDDLYLKNDGDEMTDDLYIANTKKIIIKGQTAGEDLEMYGEAGTAATKWINQVNDGSLSIRGFHSLLLGTNDAPAGTKLTIAPTLITSGVDIRLASGKILKSGDGDNIIQDIPFSSNWSNYDKEAISGKQLYYKIHSIDDNIEGLRAVQHLQGVWTPAAVDSSYKERRGEAIPGVAIWGTSGSPDLSGWTDTSGAGCTVSIVSPIGNHTNVMKLDDQSVGNVAEIRKTFTNQTDGILDFYYRVTDNTVTTVIRLDESGAEKITLRIDTGNLQYYDGGWINIVAISNNVLYHISIVFDCGTDTYDIYINGNLEGNDFAFHNGATATNLNRLVFITNAAASGHSVYVDSVGFSWDGYISWSNYFIALDYPSNPNIGDYYIIDTETEISGIQFKKWDWIVWNGLRWIHITTLQQELTVRVRPGESIQDTIDIVLAAGGGTIMLMEGTHDLAGTSIEIDDGDGTKTLRIIGMGNASIIDCGGDNAAIDVNTKQIGHLTLKDFAIDANDLTTNTTAIIYIDETSNNPVIIDNITIYGDGTNGRGIQVDSQNVTVKYCHITNLSDAILPYTGNGSYANIHNNWIKGMVSRGIYVKNESDYITIKDNHIEDCNIGIECEGQYFLIEGNRIIDCGATAISVDEDGHGNVIDNNIYDFVKYGIHINCDYVTCVSNVIDLGADNHATPNAGIYVQSGSNFVTVIGNITSNVTNTGAGEGYGIQQGQQTGDVVIIGNSGYGCDKNYDSSRTRAAHGNDTVWYDENYNFWFQLLSSANDIHMINYKGNAAAGADFLFKGSDLNATDVWCAVLHEASMKVKSDLSDIQKIDFDSDNWKDNYPEELKEVKDNIIGIDVGGSARLALKGIKELKELLDRQAIEIEDLKKRVG